MPQPCSPKCSLHRVSASKNFSAVGFCPCSTYIHRIYYIPTNPCTCVAAVGRVGGHFLHCLPRGGTSCNITLFLASFRTFSSPPANTGGHDQRPLYLLEVFWLESLRFDIENLDGSEFIFSPT